MSINLLCQASSWWIQLLSAVDGTATPPLRREGSRSGLPVTYPARSHIGQHLLIQHSKWYYKCKVQKIGGVIIEAYIALLTTCLSINMYSPLIRLIHITKLLTFIISGIITYTIYFNIKCTYLIGKWTMKQVVLLTPALWHIAAKQSDSISMFAIPLAWARLRKFILSSSV